MRYILISLIFLNLSFAKTYTKEFREDFVVSFAESFAESNQVREVEATFIATCVLFNFEKDYSQKALASLDSDVIESSKIYTKKCYKEMLEIKMR